MAAIAGLLIGGLVNALADDLPTGRRLGPPRYRDGSPRPLWAWLGLTDCILRALQPKASARRLPWRYPLTEIALAALLATTQAALGQNLILQVFAAGFVLLAIADIEHRQILMGPLLALAMLELIDAAFITETGPGLATALAGGLVGGCVFAALYLGGKFYGLVTGSGEALGLGDVYLMGAAGLFLGFPNVLAAIMMAIALGGCAALLMLMMLRLRGRLYRRHYAMAYAPYILAATYACLLFPSELSRLASALHI